MKAEHRKELQTNSLSRQLSNLINYSKKPPSTIWMIVGVIVLLAIAYWWLTSMMANRAGSSWIALWNWRNSIENAPKQLAGTAADKALQLLQADSLFDTANENMMLSPQMAQDGYREASAKYEEVAKAVGSQPFMALRANMGAARSAEAMGDIARARTFYEAALKVAESHKWTDHPLALDARQRLQAMEQKGDAVAFYANWPDRLPKSKPTDPKAPPTPFEPPPLSPTSPTTTAPSTNTFAPPMPSTQPTASTPQTSAPMNTAPTQPTPTATKPIATMPSTPTKAEPTKPK